MWFFPVLVMVLFKGVTSDIDDGFDTNFIGLDSWHDSQNDPFVNQPLYPNENPFWQSPENLGEISGVAVDPSGKVVIFHRADRIWNYNTFNEDGEYQERYKGPIQDNTVLALNPKSGDIIYGWGNQTFYLPHGIYIDDRGNVWLTDIALQQVFKYSPSGVPQMVLGQRFESGSDNEHFCQPTSVAVAPGGQIVVADGYCNSRLVLFDFRGNFIYSIDEDWISLRIPHGLTILSNREVCIADRENSRIVCLNIGLSGPNRTIEPPYSIRSHQFGRIFAVTSYRDIIYAVNGITSNKIQVKGFTVDPVKRSVINTWGPKSSLFVRPHAIAICPNGTALYVSEIGPNRVWKFDLIDYLTK